MKFAVVIDEVRLGGVEKVAIEEVRALNELGHDATLVVLKRTPSRAFADKLVNIETIYFSDLLPKAFRFSFRLPIFRFFSLFHITYAFFARFVRLRTRFDAVIVHGTYTCFSGVNLARAESIPLIAFVWDPVSYILQSAYFGGKSISTRLLSGVTLSVARLLDQWICQNAARVLTGSRFHLARLQRLSTRPEKVTLLFPGVHIRADVRQQRRSCAIMATAWKRGKQPDYVLDLVKRIEELQFIVAGGWIDEPMRDNFLSQIRSLGLTRRVSVVGWLEESKLLGLYSESLVFLQAKADVGFGLPALEAAGQGCTFIIPKGQGVCDLFVHGRDGFMVTEKDTEQIVELLREFSESPERAIRMGHSAWLKAGGYSWENHAQQLSAIAVAALH